MGSSVSVPERKIVLLGKTGDGKSSAGNTILGEYVFTTKALASNAGVECQKTERKVHGRKITVIDSPGDPDTDCDDEALKSETIKCLVDCAPGVDAFIIVLKVGRYTRHENKVVQKLLNTYSKEQVLKHTVVLFTHGEQLEGQTIETFVKANSKLQELVDKCGGRCHVIDNKYWNKCKRGYKSNRVQVKNLLETIDEMVKENGCYTNELFQKIEGKIQEDMKINKDNLPPEDKREKAKGIVKKMMLQVVGATTGMLIGALLGVGVAIAAVLQVLCPVNALLQAKMTAAVQAAEAAGGACTAIAVGVLNASALVGAVAGGVTGWKAAEEADSVYDAMTKAAKLNYENATVVAENMQKCVANAFSKTQTEENKNN